MSTELTPDKLRSALISMLRDQTLWPADFVWDFSHCETCAMGLLMKMRRRKFCGHEEEMVGEMLGLTFQQAHEVFSSPAWDLPELSAPASVDRSYQAVTPTMVADRLEKCHREIMSA